MHCLTFWGFLHHDLTSRLSCALRLRSLKGHFDQNYPIRDWGHEQEPLVKTTLRQGKKECPEHWDRGHRQGPLIRTTPRQGQKEFVLYHWWELPQVLFLLRQKFCCDKHVFVATKHVFCRDKSMLVTTKCLLRQTYFCCDKTFVKTNICCDKHNFVAAKLLSWQAYFCCDKHVKKPDLLLRQKYACHNKSFVKHKSVATKRLSQQAYYCHDKRYVLSWQTRV